MTWEEKSTWLTGASLLAVTIWYFTATLGELGTTPVEAISYQWRLIVMVVVSVALIVVGSIVVAIANPKAAGRADERDVQINRFGEYVGGYVLGTGMVVALMLTMVEFDHFWIAQAIVVTLVVSEFVTIATKLLAYRRGI